MLAAKRRVNTLMQRPKLWAAHVDWPTAKEESIVWIIEAFIEGFLANFATHFLIGLPLTPMTLLAHGIAIKQGISVYRRLRGDGSSTKIPTKDKREY